MEISIKWNVCRICLAEDKPNEEMRMLDIFLDNKLAQQIYDCSGVKMKQSDNLPEKICKKCMLILRHALQFRTTCRNSNKYLQAIVQKTKSASTLFKVEKTEEQFDSSNVDLTNAEFSDEDNEIYEITQIENDDDVDGGASTKDLLCDLGVLEADDYTEDLKNSISVKVKLREDLENPIKVKNFEDESKREEENTHLETAADESVDNDVIYFIGDDIKQENSTECDIHYEIEDQSCSSQMTVDGYSIDNECEEFTTIDSAVDDSEHKLPIKPTIRKYEKKKVKTPKTFICDICGNNFQKRNLLNFHMKIHRNEKRFECEFCDKRFNSACNLTAHMRTHTGEKPFVCNFCQRRFSDRSTQKKHERIHTNEKPFKCETCGKCFSLSTTLKAHEKIHSGERPHKCETCERAFTLPHQLKAHLSTHVHRMLTLVK